jgi:hypothetical protein
VECIKIVIIYKIYPCCVTQIFTWWWNLHQPLSLPIICIINYLLVFNVASAFIVPYSGTLSLLALFGPIAIFCCLLTYARASVLLHLTSAPFLCFSSALTPSCIPLNK